jgi:DNA invertase Pin-like site-specific DNA recombinase
LGKLNRPRSNGVDKGKMKTLLDEGKTITEIMGILKCSDTTVKNFKRGMKNGNT